MLRDISKSHKILSIHAELQINVEDHSKNPYYRNVTKRDISTAPLVPLLPGHCVIGKFAKVNSIYPNIFETSVALTKPQNKMVKLTATMQKKGEKIIAKARNSSLISQDPIICQGIEIKETGLNLSSEATLALAIDYESSKKSSDALRKRFKRAKADLEYAKNLKIRIH
ncbi:2899_t:CDS:2 [Entrophospora sp. SA101]|nr:2899_t:CDS:2 [Entrophospora sp. SA101]